MKSVDLVVTSDTAVAHLAGALGVPVWLALPFVPDWRWLLGRDGSRWYPTMRLFRQTRVGEWEEVFARLADALHRRVTVCQPSPIAIPGAASRAQHGHETLDRRMNQRTTPRIFFLHGRCTNARHPISQSCPGAPIFRTPRLHTCWFSFSSSVSADDAEIGKILGRRKGPPSPSRKASSPQSRFKTGRSGPTRNSNRSTRLGNLKTLSLSNGLNKMREAFASFVRLWRNPRIFADQPGADHGRWRQAVGPPQESEELEVFPSGQSVLGRRARSSDRNAEPQKGSYGRRLSGYSEFNDDGMAAVAKLTGLKEFRTWHAGATNDGVKKLKDLKNLKSLYLGQPPHLQAAGLSNG